MLLLVSTCAGSGSASSAGNSTARSDGFATAATACKAKTSLLVIVTASYICFSYCPTIARSRHGKCWGSDLKMTSYMQRGRFSACFDTDECGLWLEVHLVNFALYINPHITLSSTP